MHSSALIQAIDAARRIPDHALAGLMVGYLMEREKSYAQTYNSSAELIDYLRPRLEEIAVGLVVIRALDHSVAPKGYPFVSKTVRCDDDDWSCLGIEHLPE